MRVPKVGGSWGSPMGGDLGVLIGICGPCG